MTIIFQGIEFVFYSVLVCSRVDALSRGSSDRGNIFFSFLEYARELCIFVLRRRKMVPYNYHHLTPDRAVRG
jgi:hypothetical protein